MKTAFTTFKKHVILWTATNFRLDIPEFLLIQIPFILNINLSKLYQDITLLYSKSCV